MTIAPYEQPASPQVVMADYQTRAVQRLAEWATSADAAYEVATRLVQSSFVPAAFRGKPIEATAAILAGAEVGLSPMSALKAFDVIQGQAAPRAITLRAVVQSFGHDMMLIESTNTRCRMRGRRKGSDEWQTVTWTMDRARDLQLTGKDNWKKQPGAMLVARATSELARLIAADAILGIGYTAEEVMDGATLDMTAEPIETAPASSGTRTMRRRQPEPVQAEESQPVDAEEVPDDEPPAEPMVTRPQLTKIAACMGDLGITDRTLALEYVSKVIGREVGSRNELTKTEAHTLIEALEADQREIAGDPS